ncbi:MAG: hypothetical protein ACQES4_02670 [Bacillota bacterium]
MADGEYKGSKCDKYLFAHIREEHPETSSIAFVMKQKEVDKVLSHPGVIVVSDGNINMRSGHPGVSGTYPKVLHKYAKDKSDEELTFYIEKMSKIPATKLGLNKKGEV